MRCRLGRAGRAGCSPRPRPRPGKPRPQPGRPLPARRAAGHCSGPRGGARRARLRSCPFSTTARGAPAPAAAAVQKPRGSDSPCWRGGGRSRLSPVLLKGSPHCRARQAAATSTSPGAAAPAPPGRGHSRDKAHPAGPRNVPVRGGELGSSTTARAAPRRLCRVSQARLSHQAKKKKKRKTPPLQTPCTRKQWLRH